MSDTMTVTVSSKGQVTLPVDWRKSNGLERGGECDAVPVGDGLLIKPRPKRRGAAGLLEHLMEQTVAFAPVQRHHLPFK
jgi:bifunctional DNA-binding transcriptional regulator/antitoxin component of YhaV-PrlF toxin-antitoxin module